MYETKADRVLLANIITEVQMFLVFHFLKWSVTFESFRDEMGFRCANELSTTTNNIVSFYNTYGKLSI